MNAHLNTVAGVSAGFRAFFRSGWPTRIFLLPTIDCRISKLRRFSSTTSAKSPSTSTTYMMSAKCHPMRPTAYCAFSQKTIIIIFKTQFTALGPAAPSSNFDKSATRNEIRISSVAPAISGRVKVSTQWLWMTLHFKSPKQRTFTQSQSVFPIHTACIHGLCRHSTQRMELEGRITL